MTECLSEITPHIQLVGGGKNPGDSIALVSTSLNGFAGITGTAGNADCGLARIVLVRRHSRGRPGVTTIMQARGDINTCIIRS